MKDEEIEEDLPNKKKKGSQTELANFEQKMQSGWADL